MRKFKNYLGLAAVTCTLCFVMTGCGNNKTNSTSGNNNNKTNNNNVVSDVVDDVGTAVGDVANGVGNAVNDLVGNSGFNNYTDAHDYFLDTMGAYHSDAKFEIRNEDKNLNDYQEGSKGYHFHLYDTSNNAEGELFGEFFVDANSGAIYKKDTNGTITEYPGTTENNTNANAKQGGTTNNTTQNGNVSNGNTTTNGTNNVTGATGTGNNTGAAVGNNTK